MTQEEKIDQLTESCKTTSSIIGELAEYNISFVKIIRVLSKDYYERKRDSPQDPDLISLIESVKTLIDK